MDLSVYSLPRLIKEKRERQPNWTEHEKQLLLSLTRSHQAILENKGSDTTTLKRKSEAWNEIALHMHAAGYNRSKERLKQQLGRIRAAESKRVKEALEKSLTIEENSSNTITDHDETLDGLGLQDNNKCNENKTSPPSSEENNLLIKVERVVSTDGDSNIDEPNCLSPQSHGFTAVNVDCGKNSGFVQQGVMHLMLQNIQSLSEITKATKPTEDLNVQVSPAAGANTDTLNTKRHTMNREDHHILGQREDVENKTKTSPKERRKKRRMRSFPLTGFRTPPRKEQRLKQIHLYRVAVERERLRALKTQQKRDRILHRKDVQIQNLKLQILRNITNQTRDGNRINL